MKERSGLAVALAVTLAMATRVSAGPVGATDGQLAQDAAGIAASGNAFALDLYAQLQAQEGNLFFSPYSLSTALAMTYAGAAGNTATEMERVLHFRLPRERLHPGFASLRKEVEGAGDAKGCELTVANALWGQKGFTLLPAFLDLLKADYGAPIEQVDFAGATEAARKRINDWAAEETRGKVKDLIAPRVLDPRSTLLVLTDAIYFKGAWLHPFDKAATTQAPFWTSPEESTPAPMMSQAGQFGYGESGLCQVLELPYAGRAFSMVVLLPRRRDGLPELERALAPEALARWTGDLQERRVAVTLPKLKLGQEFRLDQVLQKMGMVHAFSDADFSNMTGRRDLSLSAVVHKAVVDVNEEGTEAAAASAVIMGRAAAPSAPPVEFRADHPFLFLIRHRQSASVFFMGRLVRPEMAP